MTTPSSGPPAPSEQSQRWLEGVRAQVKARLFAGEESLGSASTFAAGKVLTDSPGPADGPARIGRFVVIKRIGEGGMGVIYAAYDDQLDRKIAVKLLRPDGTGGTGTDGRARLMREAQALARLSHESVISVYEVGPYEDQVYVAMEFVDGGTLKQWQAEPNRPWRDLLEAYIRAGRGLAAAHAASIVHRDFKPDNVLVRRDGAVRVVDFGLARREFEGPTPRKQVLRALSESSGEISIELADLAVSSIYETFGESPQGQPLTRTGVIMGTPAYMAPEQHLGTIADARSDQFSYCVALYEAFYGFRPFPGDTLSTLRRNVLTGNLQAPPKYTDVPLRVHDALARGLSVRPDARHASMESLLEALTHDPRQVFRRVLLGLAIVVTIALGVGMYWADREERGVHAVGQGLRQRFDSSRAINAEAELRRAQSRTVSEKWDDLVLTYARGVVDLDPARAIAALKHLTKDNEGWLPGARAIAADALRRGIVHRRLARPDGGTGRIDTMTFAANGALFFSGVEGIVYRWTERTGQVSVVGTTDSAVRQLALSQDAARLVAACADGRTHLWQLNDPSDTGHRIVEPADGSLTAVALAADGSMYVTGSTRGTIRITSWAGTRQRVLTDHTGPIRGLALSANSGILASGSDDGRAILWYLDRQTHIDLVGHNAGVGQVLFDDGDERLLSVGEDGGVRFWLTSTGLGGREMSPDPVRMLARTPDGSTTLSIATDQGASVSNAQGTHVRLEGLPGAATAVAVRQNGALAAVATGDGSVLLWKLAAAGSSAVFPDGSRVTDTPGALSALAWDARGERIATGSLNGSVDLWQADGTKERQLAQIARGVVALQFAPNNDALAGLDDEGVLLIWSITDSPEPHMASPDGQRIAFELVWSPNSDHVAVGECQKIGCWVVLHDVDGEVVTRLPRTRRPADRIRFSDDGRWLASEHDDGPQLWDLARGEGVPLSWPDDMSPAQRLALVFTADGQNLRFATSTPVLDDAGHQVATTLAVWQAGIASGDVHLLFEEPELSMLLSDADFVTLLLRTHDGRTLLWTLDDDAMQVLPGIPPGYDRLLVAPDRDALLLLPEDRIGLEPRWTHVQTGQSRGMPRLRNPIAWSSQGILADVGAPSELRLWLDATPATVPLFRAWLEETTDLSIDPSTIR